MAKHLAIKSGLAGPAVDDGVPDGLTCAEAQAWEALLTDWRTAYEAVAAFSRFEEGTLKAQSLEQLCELERRARQRVDGFLEALG